ncbi:hypothetical protein [Halonatronum saccharophilum]|uniref:hypothetical protein n=1 Tax=Halonatronum saccharophilum TaxID=150060 RepID=UPI0004857910|nr:hypothetical protein [Halonatronum saccharophilum]
MKKKFSVMIVLALVLALAVPAFAAVEGELDSKVEVDVVDGDSEVNLILADGELAFVDMPEDMELTSLFNVERNDDGDFLFRVGPNFEYTGVENFTLGVMGDLDDDFMFQAGDQVGDYEDDYAIKFYGDYAMNLAPGWTLGSDNNFVIRDESDDTVTINPFVKYELAVSQDATAGFKADYELEDAEFEFDFDDKTLGLEAFYNVDTVLGNGATLVADNSLEYSKHTDADDGTITLEVTPKLEKVEGAFTFGVMGGIDFDTAIDEYDDDQLFVYATKGDISLTVFGIKPYVEMEVESLPGLNVGADFTYRMYDLDLDFMEVDYSETVLKPYATYEMPLSQDLTFISELSYEIYGGDNEDDDELSIMAGVNLKF